MSHSVSSPCRRAQSLIAFVFQVGVGPEEEEPGVRGGGRRGRKANWKRRVDEEVAEQHQQDGKDEGEEENEEEADVEVEVLLAAAGRCPRISAGTLQRGIPIPRCCL